MNTLKHFDELLLNSIDKTLRNTLGVHSKELIQQQLMRNNSVEWCKIPQNLQIFRSNLHSLFGSSQFIIKDLILENLYYKLGLVFNSKKGYKIQDYIKELRKIMASSSFTLFLDNILPINDGGWKK